MDRGLGVIIYLQYAIGVYLILSLVIIPLFLGNDNLKQLDRFLKPMPLAISFFPLYYGYHFIINKKIIGNELYEMDLSMLPYWVPFLLGLSCIYLGLKILYESYFN